MQVLKKILSWVKGLRPKHRIKAMYDFAKKQTKKAVKWIKFYKAFAKLKLTNFYLGIKNKLYTYQLSIVTGALLGSLLCIAISAPEHVHDKAFLYDHSIELFSGMGFFVGGALAIVFTLNTLIIQHAAQNLPAGFYRLVGKRTRINTLYALISIACIAFIVFAITTSERLLDTYLRISVILVGIVFYLLYVIFLRVRKALDPYWMLNEIYRHLTSILKSTKDYVEKMADVLYTHPSNKDKDRNKALAASYQRAAPNFTLLNAQMNYLFDFHKKALADNQKTLALDYLSILTRVIIDYFQMRKDSSFAVLTDQILVTSSDSEHFLSPNLERLLDIGKDYINAGDGEGIRRVITTFETLCQASTQVKFISTAGDDNQIFRNVQAI